MKTVMVISDATGETASRMVHAALLQFQRPDTKVRIFSQVRLESEIEKIIEQATEERALVVFTAVDESARELLWSLARHHGVECLDLMDLLLDKLGSYLECEPVGIPGLLHAMREDYFRRIDAVEFAVKNDDCAKPHNLPKADLVVVGISRTSKTPLSTYLAQKGLRVANVPLIQGIEPPAELAEVDDWRVFGLVIRPEALVSIRRAKLAYLGMPKDSPYAAKEHIDAEIAYAKKILRNHPNWPVLDVTNKTIEETASDILRIYSGRKPQNTRD